MKPTKIIYLLAAVLLIVVVGYMSFGSDDSETYTAKVMEERSQKDKDFKYNERISPLEASQRGSFEHLTYFEVLPAYKVEAHLEVLNEDSVLKMTTTRGETQKYVRYAKAHFSLEGKPHSLTVFRSVDRMTKGVLFLPFTDLTNGEETYGAGRYIEVKSTNGSTMTIDFNKAYNPYCAYNEQYSCPIPPRENHLAVAIRAGEKNFAKEKP